MILVTGSTGHIGNVVIRELLMRGKRVRAFVLRGEDLTPLKDLDVEIYEGDVLEPASLEKAMKGVGMVFHLAGMISILPGQFETMRRINVEGTRNVVEAAKKMRVKRLIYTSSIHALRRIPEGTVVNEEIDFDPENCMGDYDRTKAQASLIVLEAAHQGLDAVIVCPTGVIGPYDYKKSEMGALLLEWTKRKPSIIIDGSYDFVDVRDVARGHVLASERGKRGEVYILSGERIHLTQLMKMVFESTDRPNLSYNLPLKVAKFFTIFTPLYYRLTHSKARLTKYSIETVVSNSLISNDKARTELGYKPRSISVTISDTVRWLMENKKYLKQS